MKVEEILKTTEFLDFYKSATDYCNFIDNYSKQSQIDFLKIARQKLLKLYDKALDLQWVDLQSNIEYAERLDDKEFKSILSFLADKLDDKRYYWHVFDPTNHTDTEPVCGDLVDDLSDIYKDIKYSIMIYSLDREDCKENALWQFKFDFDKHWGDHCINALTGIHFILQDE